mmetsp:Transcript_83472/g.115204  ORF Transcript_83472/g.115204 Transcript_83472/m.115204 type:complete len:126 (+) Transcript_83472:420-797(+)|eukprot:CAMPEP_0176380656 /NCGR_PEP_ID=MMETSP0126-20121128/31295_1 /TAXON_ID=141414 ORGANISM="Strombidinopsis acuminatum, Strain SPMC142" /NCGR_SAMPLE_ID=MMETSP0126 /ASSEMBLY_ACC=CAM_ASM_000229 /LENGTH=125 /DNA_ID=CAMNT_0017744089 /DNA_START=1102 /DNA_END=1479 /DNA_ORIENTATION=+
MFAKREKVLKSNQEHLAKGGMETESEDGASDDYDDFDGDESGEEVDMSSGNKKRKPKKGQYGFDESDDDDDLSDDSGYEYGAGDLALFDSRLDNEDELKAVKEVFDSLHSSNADYLMHLLSKVDQ